MCETSLRRLIFQCFFGRFFLDASLSLALLFGKNIGR